MRTNRKVRQTRRRRKYIKRQRGGVANDKVLFCKLHAGFGNNIFIYAASLAVKDLLEMNILLIRTDTNPNSISRNPHSNVDYTPFFKRGKAVNLSEVQSRFDHAVKLPQQIGKNSVEFMNKIPEYKKTDIKLESTFYHDYKLVEPVVNTIRIDIISELESRYPDFKKSVLNDLREDKMAFMHVRKGDFDSHGWSSNTEYFKSALGVLGDTPDIIHIISNDIPYCKEQIKNGMWSSKKLKIFEDPDELKAMYLMILCRGGAIISASTFSWWGAILGANNNLNSTILYPKEAIYNTVNKLTFPERVGNRWRPIPDLNS